jgi:Reverse transcriptase (RNA-dependent DNA polymerase)
MVKVISSRAHADDDVSWSSVWLSPLNCGVPQGRVLGLKLFLLYTADVTGIARRHGLGVHSYADDTHMYLNTTATALAKQSVHLTPCITEINSCMESNSLKLNTDKTQFLCAGTRQQLAKVTKLNTFSDRVTLLSVMVDRELTFAPHIRRLTGRCFCKLPPIWRTLTLISPTRSSMHSKRVAWTKVTASSLVLQAFISGSYSQCSTQLQDSTPISGCIITSPQRYVMTCTGFPSFSVSITKPVSSSIRVCIS